LSDPTQDLRPGLSSVAPPGLTHAFDQGAAAFVEQGPSFFVGFVAVAVLLERLDGVEHEAGFALGTEEQGGGDDVPGFDGDDVGGEEVELGESVVLLFEVVGLELAEVSGAGAAGGGLDLHAQEVGAVVDANVVGASVSPGLEDVEAALGGGRHEAEFDPLSALLEAFEFLPLVFLRLIHGFDASLQKEKARLVGRACIFLKFYLIA